MRTPLADLGTHLRLDGSFDPQPGRTEGLEEVRDRVWPPGQRDRVVPVAVAVGERAGGEVSSPSVVPFSSERSTVGQLADAAARRATDFWRALQRMQEPP